MIYIYMYIYFSSFVEQSLTIHGFFCRDAEAWIHQSLPRNECATLGSLRNHEALLVRVIAQAAAKKPFPALQATHSRCHLMMLIIIVIIVVIVIVI